MKKIIFIGTNYFASYILEKMIKKKFDIICVITKEDKNSGRGQKKIPCPVKNVSIANKIKIISTNNVNHEYELIKNINPDIIIITEFSNKIGKTIIDIPLYGIINIHPSLLPKLRGATPIQSAIIKGYKKTGISIIKINENYDEGMILNSTECNVSKNETYDSLFKKLKILGFKCLLKTLKNIKYNTCENKIQDNKYKTKTYKIKKEFYNINWFDSANKINKKIRSTFSIAKHHSFIENNYINIIETTVLKKKNLKEIKPGTITNVNTYGIDVKTGFGFLRIKKIQFPGKKKIFVKDILNSKSYLFKIGNEFKKNLEKK